SVLPEVALQVEDDPNLKLIQEGNNTAEITVGMNNSKPPFDNPLVRQAITHAIDKNAITQGAMSGFGTPISTFATPLEPYYVDPNPYPYDPEKAKALLAKAGYTDGLTFRFELPPYPLEKRTGEVIAQQLAEVGITAEVTNIEWTTWLERVYKNADYDMTIIGHVEPRDIVYYGNPDYYFKYNNPDVVELITQAESVADEAAQMELYKEVANTIATDAASVWVFTPSNLVAARKDVYGFWKNSPTVAIDLTKVYRAE
ncbi:MAG: ABC transporter substrate-binding protein, partial [Trueperaceae bacterium]